MLGTLIGAFIAACFLVLIIKMFTGDDVGLGSAFFASLVASFVSAFLTEIALRSAPNLTVLIVSAILITLLVTGAAVQFLCSTDLRTIIKISVTFTILKVAYVILLVRVLMQMHH